MSDPVEWSKEVGGDFIESLQLQAVTLIVKALMATHPEPGKLRDAMNDLFAQFQASAIFLSLPDTHRNVMREMFGHMLPGSHEATVPESD